MRGIRCGGDSRRTLAHSPYAGASFRRSRYCLTGSRKPSLLVTVVPPATTRMKSPRGVRLTSRTRSEEHTSELQSQSNLVCRLLLEKKKKKQNIKEEKK